MKKLFLLILLFGTTSLYAQKIKVNQIDKFTKAETIETSSETLYTSVFMGGLANIQYQFSFLIRRTNGSYTMPAQIVLKECFKFDESSTVTFLLNNGETITLKTLYTGVSTPVTHYGWGFDTCFSLSENDVAMLKSNTITDVRISYMGGSYDRQLKSKKQEILQKCLLLFDGLNK